MSLDVPPLLLRPGAIALICACATAGLFGCAPTLYLVPDTTGVAAVPPTTETLATAAPSELPLLPAGQSPPPYRIGPGDQVVISVWGRPDLGSQIPAEGDNRRNISIIQEDGTVSLPLVGRLKVGGLTAKDVADLTKAAYEPYAQGSAVDASIVGFSSQRVVVAGSVQRPGTVVLTETVRTLADVLTAAGGPTADADTTRINLTRAGVTFRIDYRAAALGEVPYHQALMKSGDRLYLPGSSEYVVLVLGEVLRPGPVNIPAQGLTLLEALSRAGGPSTETAAYKSIYLARNVGGRYNVSRLSLKELYVSPDVDLATGDRIFVAPTALALWDRSLRQTLSALRIGINATAINLTD